MIEERRDLLLQAITLPRGFFGGLPRRAATLQGGLVSGQVFTHLGHRTQDGLGQFLDDMELADLVRNVAENRTQRLWI